MKTVRFSKVVEKCGKPEVYLLMTETDAEFQKALHADKIMSLSGGANGSALESGTVGYNKKRRGQLLMFPKSLKFFSDVKIVGIKYDIFAEESSEDDEKSSSSNRMKEAKQPKLRNKSKPKKAQEKTTAKAKKAEPKTTSTKVIPFPAKKAELDDDDDNFKAFVRQAMKALEKGNSVAAYNILKRVVPEP